MPVRLRARLAAWRRSSARAALIDLLELELRDARLDRADLAAQLLGPLRRGRLEGEWPEPLLDLGLEVASTLDLGRDARELQLRAVPAPLELAQAGGLLDEPAPLLGLRAEDLLDPALADDRAHPAAETHVGEQLDEVGPPHGRAVDEVLPLAAAMQPARERDLGERQLGERAVLVVEDELDLAEVGRAAVLAAGEQDVVGLLGAKLARTRLPAAQSIASDTFDLPEPFGPDDDGDALLEADLDRVGKRLEAAQLDRSQVHAEPNFDEALGRQAASPVAICSRRDRRSPPRRSSALSDGRHPRGR